MMLTIEERLRLCHQGTAWMGTLIEKQLRELTDLLATGRALFTAKESGWYTPKYSVYLSVGDGEKRDDVAFAREITEYLREVE